jgi:hypothetical protein
LQIEIGEDSRQRTNSKGDSGPSPTRKDSKGVPKEPLRASMTLDAFAKSNEGDTKILLPMATLMNQICFSDINPQDSNAKIKKN